MAEPRPIDGRDIGRIYDQQSSDYADFADHRFAWKYLEQPAYDRYIPDLYNAKTRVLDIGCGTGTVARYLISRGVLPYNIIGIDPSRGQLEQAKTLTPGVRFVESSAEEFDFPAGSIDLVTTNTVMHHLDNTQFGRMLNKVYDVLSPNGVYFFVDVDPDHSFEGKDPQNTNRWTTVKTPWKTEVPFYNRSPYEMVDALDRHGFDKVSGWVLKVDPKGIVEPAEYTRYSSRPSRMAARYQKASEQTRFLRMNDVRVPNLVETPRQGLQRRLVERYFRAWSTQSVDEIENIFSRDAVYREKPGIEEPLYGIEAIKKYWRINPLSQRNINMNHKIIGFSKNADAIWSEFKGGFNARGRHIDINGVIGFTTDVNGKKIVDLTESFTTEKTPL